MIRPADRRVAVLGAGPAGLAAAEMLSRHGVRVDVLELQDTVGGLCVTHEYQGFRFDLGGHRWFTKNRELQRWFLDLMQGELVTVQRRSRIYFNRRYFNYPISLSNVLENAGWWTSLKVVWSYAAAAAADLMRRRPPATMKEMYCAQFGAQLYEMFFRRYSEKVWGRPCELLSPDWVAQRSKGLSILTAVKDALTQRHDVVSLGDQFVYPRAGYQRICVRMAEEVTRRGHRVRLEAPVKAVSFRGPHDLVVHYETQGARRALECTDVVSTLPLSHLVAMLEPPGELEVQALARALEFRDLITVVVLIDKPRVSDDTWIYIHDDSILFARVHEPKNWSAALVPDPRLTSLVCECFCSCGDPIWNLGDDQLRARVVADLSERLGFITPAEVIGTRVIRTRYAYPVYDLEYRGKLVRIYRFLARHPGLHIVGRGGTFRYNNADHSIEMGQRLARRLLGEDQDPLRVNIETEYLEEIRGERVGVQR
ncbi:MAG TPA: FAD-dependent oxidoreductase [Acidobacteriota bacterium]